MQWNITPFLSEINDMTRSPATPVRIAKIVAVPEAALTNLKTRATITIISNIEYFTTGMISDFLSLLTVRALEATASREPK